jgi:hypothetical protein
MILINNIEQEPISDSYHCNEVTVYLFFKVCLTPDFRLQVFLWISFPGQWTPSNAMGAISKFYENSRRYSKVNLNHRFQRHR